MKHLIPLTALLIAPLLAQNKSRPLAGADQNTPSLSHYFTWINNTNEGTTEYQTFDNMDFFQWMHDEYGMVLDIYAFDAGAVDAPSYYGRPDTRKFERQFPGGFEWVADRAKRFGGRLGVWLGPDGFGDTPEEEKARIDFLTSLCRDHKFQLFKMDAVCGQLREEKQDAFIRLMESCRKHTPDLILLNHRLALGKAEPHATTFLWEGAETYIDVHMVNSAPATHNRAGALGRGLPPELKRLAEDHGVCLSSCLDYWQDDLILQAFNRSMILAPQLYGSPWFLRDDEYPQLARIFNLHRKYRDILTRGIVLPEAGYGPNAVSRGDDKTRLITLRNLTWEPVTYEVALNATIGLDVTSAREARLLHPYEEILGTGLKATDTVKVTVHPFRSLLLLVSAAPITEPSLKSGPYRVVRNVPGADVEIDQLTPLSLKNPWHRKLADLQPAELPTDWAALYEATCFAADNNALELRSLERSGPTKVPAVEKARKAFLGQRLMTSRALSDRYLFDGDTETVFATMGPGKDLRISDGCLRVDFAEAIDFDSLRITTQAPDRTLQRNLVSGAQFSMDLKTWAAAEEVIQDGNHLDIYPPPGAWRYFRMGVAPERVGEIDAWVGSKTLDRSKWRASHLFAHPEAVPAVAAWSAKVMVDEITPTSYLCVAVDGKHGVEGCYAALRVDGKELVGSPDRAPSYPAIPWEYPVRSRDGGYTYFFPLDESMVGKSLEVVLLGMKGGGAALKPSVWLTARDIPFTTTRQKIAR